MEKKNLVLENGNRTFDYYPKSDSFGDPAVDKHYKAGNIKPCAFLFEGKERQAIEFVNECVIASAYKTVRCGWSDTLQGKPGNIMFQITKGGSSSFAKYVLIEFEN